MENDNTTTANDPARIEDLSPADLQDWQDWRAACLEADMGEPFLDDAH